MKPLWLLSSLFIALASHRFSVADELSWTFQRTGYRTSSFRPQTALSMRSNLSWPVVYAIDESNQLSAYSLFTTPGSSQPSYGSWPYIPTNWHVIGSNLTQSYLQEEYRLQAASGSPDGFGVSLQTGILEGGSQQRDVTIQGTSRSGFQTPSVDTSAIKYDAGGVAYTADQTTIPGLPSHQKLFDVAKSTMGDMAAITQASWDSGPISFWQKSPLLNGAWLSVELPEVRNNSTLQGKTFDLTFDTSGRPYAIGLNSQGPSTWPVAYRFDIPTGEWKVDELDSSSQGQAIFDVAAAANDNGVVGAAWVNAGVLKYAYLDTNVVNAEWIVSTVTTATPAGEALKEIQSVGLAFDRAGLPVISFVDRVHHQIWIAYDPPVVAPIAGDFNRDGFVDGGDLDIWKTAIADATASADADGDGDSDGADFLAWQRNFAPATNAAAANAAVPEPTSLVSLMTAFVAIAAASRRPRNRLQL